MEITLYFTLLLSSDLLLFLSNGHAFLESQRARKRQISEVPRDPEMRSAGGGENWHNHSLICKIRTPRDVQKGKETKDVRDCHFTNLVRDNSGYNKQHLSLRNTWK